MQRELHQSREIANRKRTEWYCVIPFLLPPPKNPCPARAQKASQAGRRRFDPGRPLSLGTRFLLWQPGLAECDREGFADLGLHESSEFQEANGAEGWLQLQKAAGRARSPLRCGRPWRAPQPATRI